MSRVRNISRSYIGGGEYQRFGDTHGQFSVAGFLPSSGNLRLGMSPFSDGAPSPNFKHWSPTCSSPNMRGPSSPLAIRDPVDACMPHPTVTPELNEVDFPPLHNKEELAHIRNTTKPLSLSWVRNGSLMEETAAFITSSTSPSSFNISAQPSTPPPASPASPASPAAAFAPVPSSLNHNNEPISHLPESPSAYVDDVEGGQEVTVPPTPEVSTTSITPTTPNMGNSYPLTPRSAASELGIGDTTRTPDAYQTTPRRLGRFSSGIMEEAEREREVDPRSLFVGNLEINGSRPWTEERLRGVFEKYGAIEEIKLYEPGRFHWLKSQPMAYS